MLCEKMLVVFGYGGRVGKRKSRSSGSYPLDSSRLESAINHDDQTRMDAASLGPEALIMAQPSFLTR